VTRRERTRQLIELGGLDVVNGGLIPGQQVGEKAGQ